MNIEKKFPQEAKNSNGVLELFFNKYTNKLSYRNHLGILTTLLENTDDVATKESVNYGLISFYGFVNTSSTIDQNLTLPDNSKLSYQGPLTLASDVVLTIPSNTSLTIV